MFPRPGGGVRTRNAHLTVRRVTSCTIGGFVRRQTRSYHLGSYEVLGSSSSRQLHIEVVKLAPAHCGPKTPPKDAKSSGGSSIRPRVRSTWAHGARAYHPTPSSCDRTIPKDSWYIRRAEPRLKLIHLYEARTTYEDKYLAMFYEVQSGAMQLQGLSDRELLYQNNATRDRVFHVFFDSTMMKMEAIVSKASLTHGPIRPPINPVTCN